ncbi:MAG: M48 family metalloprotease [Holosporales bacterium]
MRFPRFLLASLIGVSAIAQAAPQFKEGTLIRDAEIEETLHDFTAPLFETAGLARDNLHLYLVVSGDVNAAAASDYSIFLNTGLLMECKTPEQLIGVLAHETGHIADGHLARTEAAMERASLAAMAAMALGAAVAIMNPEAGMGVLTGGNYAAQGSFLHYSRGQEGSADQAGLRILQQLGWSPEGLLQFLQFLAKQELLSPDQQDSYLRTHPLTQERVSLVENKLAGKSYPKDTLPKDFYPRFRRMVAKISAFMEPATKTRLAYPDSDTRFEAQYARAIALYREGNTKAALDKLDQMLATSASDPYLWNLKGQIHYESGQIQPAVEAYRKAHQLRQSSLLLKMDYAQALLQVSTKSSDLEATSLLEDVVKKEADNAAAWRLLATAYGRQERMGNTALALAEEALLNGRFEQAFAQSKRAAALLPEGPQKMRAQDIEHSAAQMMKHAGNRR